MKTIAVDFDGVIHAYSRGWQDGSIYDEPVPGALDGVRELMTRAAVFVHTSRDARSVAAWLRDRGLRAVAEIDYTGRATDRVTFWGDQEWLLVTDRKLPAVAYLDDRGVRFTDWAQALGELTDVLK